MAKISEAHEISAEERRESRWFSPDGLFVEGVPGRYEVFATCTCGFDTGWISREEALSLAVDHADANGVPVTDAIRKQLAEDLGR
jgi:hypothetical protein